MFFAAKLQTFGTAVVMPTMSNGCCQLAIGPAGPEAQLHQLADEISAGQHVAARGGATALERVRTQEADRRCQRRARDICFRSRLDLGRNGNSMRRRHAHSEDGHEAGCDEGNGMPGAHQHFSARGDRELRALSRCRRNRLARGSAQAYASSQVAFNRTNQKWRTDHEPEVPPDQRAVGRARHVRLGRGVSRGHRHRREDR